MKIIIFVIIFISVVAIAGNVVLSQFRQKIDRALSVQPAASTPSPTPLPTPTETKETFLFVPYWAVSNDSLQNLPYKNLVYFGIAANKNGLLLQEEGYHRLNTFIESAGSKRKLLTIRMINSAENFEVLKDKKSQEKIIREAIVLAKKENFQGIVLNLELSALPFDSLIEQITFFNREFFLESKKEKLSYFVTAYGDSYYRVRPFNMSALSKDSDGIFIMTYDLHKAKGNPGPNFPLKGKEEFGYDIERMLENFSSSVDAKKITIVLGLYGYDWEVDEKENAVSMGKPLSLREARITLIDNCSYKVCTWERDILTAELQIKYETLDNKKHIVWLEDKESVKRKEEFLNSRGITSFAYWAYSYF